MPSDVFGWVLAVYWPVCFLSAIVLSLVFIKKPVTREFMAVGFGVLLLVIVAQRLFWVLGAPADGELLLPPLLMSASTALFGLGDLVGYLLIFFALVIPNRRSEPLTHPPT
jgi:hypothetical protein